MIKFFDSSRGQIVAAGWHGAFLPLYLGAILYNACRVRKEPRLHLALCGGYLLAMGFHIKSLLNHLRAARGREWPKQSRASAKLIGAGSAWLLRFKEG